MIIAKNCVLNINACITYNQITFMLEVRKVTLRGDSFFDHWTVSMVKKAREV